MVRHEPKDDLATPQETRKIAVIYVWTWSKRVPDNGVESSEGHTCSRGASGAFWIHSSELVPTCGLWKPCEAGGADKHLGTYGGGCAVRGLGRRETQRCGGDPVWRAAVALPSESSSLQAGIFGDVARERRPVARALWLEQAEARRPQTVLVSGLVTR
jgi:hypothetical protein